MRHHEIANSHQRIEAGSWRWGAEAGSRSANGAQRLFIEFGEILARKKDMARPPLQTVAEQPTMARTRMDLTGTREADYAENLAGHEIKAHPSRMGGRPEASIASPTDREYRVPREGAAASARAAGVMRSFDKRRCEGMALCPGSISLPTMSPMAANVKTD